MKPDVIFFVNYLMYILNSVIMIIASTYLLTPKYSRVKTVLIWVAAESIGGTFKYFMPLHSDADIMLGLFNSAMWVIASYILCEENLIGCLLSYGCTTIIMTLECFLWQLTPYADDTNWEIGTTINYIISIPVILISCAVLMWGKRLLKERQFGIADTKMAVLIVCVAFYFVMYTYVPVRVLADFNGTYSMMFMLEELIAGGMFLIILCMILKKCEEQRELRRCKELELIREKEQETYDMLIIRNEAMEKIRHDFYGQLAVARHIISQDRKLGIEMIKELKVKLDE